MTESFPYHGQCQCGACSVVVNLPNPLAHYTPRACDCDYCQPRKVAYLSDPEGTLSISLKNPLHAETQGSGQARFVRCQSCGDVIAATVVTDNRLLGAVNSRLLEAFATCQPAQPASPKLLSAEDKLGRWQKIWFPVTFLPI